jgi:hypothetical protein
MAQTQPTIRLSPNDNKPNCRVVTAPFIRAGAWKDKKSGKTRGIFKLLFVFQKQETVRRGYPLRMAKNKKIRLMPMLPFQWHRLFKQ